MANNYQPNVGNLCHENPRRDAIHIAVAPVTSGERLEPGNFVKLVEGKARICDPKEAIGVVDPFLVDKIEPECVFWLFIKPNTVTNLRHTWSHPAWTV